MKIIYISFQEIQPDFSADKSQNKNVLHEDILSSIQQKGMSDKIKYSTLFTNTLLQDFRDEIESVGLTEEVELKAEYERMLAIQESYSLQEEHERELVGLSSLSTNYEEVISELDDVVNFIKLIEEGEEEIRNKCEEYRDKYCEFQELIKNKDLEELNQIINGNPLLKVFIDDCEDKNEIKDSIKNLIELKIGKEDYADFIEEFESNDYFSINDTLLTFSDGFKNKYKLITSGFLNPRNHGEDTIYLHLYKNDKVIQESEINIYYGFVKFNDDGNFDDGAKEQISVNIDNLLIKLSEIKKAYL